MKPGSNLDPRKEAPKWDEHENLLDRIHACRVMLVCHGFLSQAESDRVRNRIDKWIEPYQEEP